MPELAVRLFLSVASLGLSLIGVGPKFAVIWPVSALFATYSVAAFFFEKHQLRNSGIAGWIAVADSGVIAYSLMKTHSLEQFGFLVLLPIGYAAFRFRAQSASMAPIAVAWLLVAANLTDSLSPVLLLQSVAVLVVGLLFQQVQPQTAPAFASTIPVDLSDEKDELRYSELREAYRELKDQFHNQLRESRRDILAGRLLELSGQSGDRLLRSLCRLLREYSEAESVSIHLVPDFGDALIFGAQDGEDPLARGSHLPYKKEFSEAQLRHHVELTLSSLKSDAKRKDSVITVIKHRGLMMGVLVTQSADSGRLHAINDQWDLIAPQIGSLLFSDQRRMHYERRRVEAELLYCLSSINRGEGNFTSISERVVRELFPVLNVDHFCVNIIEGSLVTRIASAGDTMPLLEVLSMQVQNELSQNRMSFAVADCYSSSECDRETALKNRVGSLFAASFGTGEIPEVLILAGRHASGGLERASIEVIHAIAAEFIQVLLRLENREESAFLQPRELSALIESQGSGALVYIVPTHTESMMEIYGRPAMQRALRSYAARLRSTLPERGALCRRNEDDFVAFLPGADHTDAMRWGREAIALASLIEIGGTSDRKGRPLAVKVKSSANEIEDEPKASLEEFV